MNERLRGKTILITGATGGLGKQTAALCAENGANLLLLARDDEKLQRTKVELQNRFSIRADIYRMDLGNGVEREKVLTEILKKTPKIDVLVNNAGFGLFKNVMDMDIREAEEMFRVNVLGVIHMTMLILPKMKEQGFGHIINIASQGGKIATPKSAVYSATKKAVLGFSDSLRMEVKDLGIFVTTVNPGPIATDFFNRADESGDYLENAGRWVLEPESVAEKIVGKMLTPVREINMPELMNIGSKIYMMFPGLVEKIGKPFFYKK